MSKDKNIKNRKRVSESFGNDIKDLRKQKGMSQMELAKKSKMSASYISRIEDRDRMCLSYPYIESLAVGLGVSVYMLIELAYKNKIDEEQIIILIDEDNDKDYENIIVVKDIKELAELVSKIMEQNRYDKTYNIFISYAGEDKSA